MNNISDEERYKLAKERVADLKGFYSHLLAYLGYRPYLSRRRCIHLQKQGPGKSWEDKKVKEFMDEE